MSNYGVEAKELPDAYAFVANVPSRTKPADIMVQLEDVKVLAIVIAGSRTLEELDPEATYKLDERNSGTLTIRRFNLPSDSNLDEVGAVYADGVLTVTVPEIPPLQHTSKTRTIANPRTIEVTVPK